MELKTKYQYSYFIHPYVIDETKYDKYLLKLITDKHCKLKIFQKEKDLDIYTYFLPNVREYMFSTFSFDAEKLKVYDSLDNSMKASLLSKYPCTMFEYTLGEDVQGKVGEDNGIFFNIEKMEIICFNTGICFILLKAVVEDDNFSNVLNFNYKFRDINGDYISLKEYENIRLQTNSLKDIKDLSTIIKNITGKNKPAKELDLEEERFITYTYTCLTQSAWEFEEDFSKIECEFYKYMNVFANGHQISSSRRVEENIKSLQDCCKIGFTKQGTAILTSEVNKDNFLKLPFNFERRYLYTKIFILYQKIYLRKILLDFKSKKTFEKAKREFLDFTKEIWIQDITNDIEGDKLAKKWKIVLDVNNLYQKAKSEYDLLYKSMNLNKNQKQNIIIGFALAGILIFNIINIVILLK